MTEKRHSIRIRYEYFTIIARCTTIAGNWNNPSLLLHIFPNNDRLGYLWKEKNGNSQNIFNSSYSYEFLRRFFIPFAILKYGISRTGSAEKGNSFIPVFHNIPIKRECVTRKSCWKFRVAQRKPTKKELRDTNYGHAGTHEDILNIFFIKIYLVIRKYLINNMIHKMYKNHG